MGACCAKGDEGRRLHVQDLIKRAAKAARQRDGYRSGTAVQAEWGSKGEWHDAIVCIDRGHVADIAWADGSFTPDVPVSKIRPVETFSTGQPVEALWHGKWLPATITDTLFAGTQYDIRWSEDGSATHNVPASFLRPAGGVSASPLLAAAVATASSHAAHSTKSGKTKGKQGKYSPDAPEEGRIHSTHGHPHLHHLKHPTQHRKELEQEGTVRLHGMLEVCIQEARNLPDADITMFCGGKPGDPYCEMYDCRGRVITKTPVIDDISDPKWKHHEKGVRVPDTDVLHFTVKDEDVGGNEIICEAVLCACNGLGIVASGQTFAGWLPLRTLNHKAGGEIFVWVRLLPQHPSLSPYEVVGSRFPMWSGNRVTLYQSAHIGRWGKTLAPLPGGHTRENCWEDICRRICQARLFIYVMGWSVNVKTRFLREKPLNVEGFGPVPITMTVGDLLKIKAAQGVKVCVLIWKEKTSIEGVIQSEGMAGTSSGQTINYFRGTDVVCKGVLRDGSKGLLSEWAVTHHQKGVITDAPLDGEVGRPDSGNESEDGSYFSGSGGGAGVGSPLAVAGGQRRVVAFIGGLDLTKGRWDTPGKEIFSTLRDHHKGDFNQVMLDADEEEGPRQPWEDIHCQLEGPAAQDVVVNFESRWKTQAGAPEALLNVEDNPMVVDRNANVYHGADAFDAQIFRSIDNYSDHTVKGIEADCHQAWVKGIERAHRFLYIENQYFMGASDAWLQGKSSATSSNRVPNVVVQRIVRAIEERKRFAAYIVIPLFPEGDPASAVMQEILFWQRQTICAMYSAIAKALQRTGSSDHPTDYLNFYTLGQRKPGEATPNQPISRSDKTRRALVLKHCRVPIYVHSKMLISDDDYIVIGSCNINDRSMAGDRDTEIAVGLHQPGRGGQGAIHAFRLSLWTEHLNVRDQINPEYLQPEAIECIRSVNAKSTDAWAAHADDYPTPQLCHLMKYPYKVSKTGAITAMQNTIPDAPGAKVLGSESKLIPDFLTS